MTSTQTFTKAAEKAGLLVAQEGGSIVARDKATDLTVASLQVHEGRSFGGYYVDRLGHVVSESTVKGLVAGIESRA
jgi:hypothetical protein